MPVLTVSGVTDSSPAISGRARSCGGREQAQGAGTVHGLVAAVDAELGVQVARVRVDGVHRQPQLGGDLGCREVGRQVAQDALWPEMAARGPAALRSPYSVLMGRCQ